MPSLRPKQVLPSAGEVDSHEEAPRWFLASGSSRYPRGLPSHMSRHLQWNVRSGANFAAVRAVEPVMVGGLTCTHALLALLELGEELEVTRYLGSRHVRCLCGRKRVRGKVRRKTGCAVKVRKRCLLHGFK